LHRPCTQVGRASLWVGLAFVSWLHCIRTAREG